MTLEISSTLLKQMETHAQASYPYECCGFFFGKEVEHSRQVLEVKAVVNSKDGDQRRRFEIAPLDYLKAERYALEQDLSLLGIYHSHPDHPATPSQHDLKQAVSFFSYIILSVGVKKINEITSWQLINGAFESENIVVKNVSEIKK